jgi:hypothetical protein
VVSFTLRQLGRRWDGSLSRLGTKRKIPVSAPECNSGVNVYSSVYEKIKISLYVSVLYYLTYVSTLSSDSLIFVEPCKRLTVHHAMEWCEGLNAESHVFLTLVLDGGEWPSLLFAAEEIL